MITKDLMHYRLIDGIPGNHRNLGMCETIAKMQII